jgi:hypothetical protein
MPRNNTTELTESQIIETYTNKVFGPVSAQSPTISASYAGKFVCVTLVATDAELSEAQMDALETSIEAITGVYKAFTLIGPARIPIDRKPVDTDLSIRVEAGFEITPIPTP